MKATLPRRDNTVQATLPRPAQRLLPGLRDVLASLWPIEPNGPHAEQARKRLAMVEHGGAQSRGRRR